MHKFTIAMLALGTVAATCIPANAQYRRHEPHRYIAPRYAPNRGSWVGPAIIGGLALGIGSALVYDRYQRHCWIEERDVVDNWGRYAGTENVRICN
jgi:hypothetical protein